MGGPGWSSSGAGEGAGGLVSGNPQLGCTVTALEPVLGSSVFMWSAHSLPEAVPQADYPSSITCPGGAGEVTGPSPLWGSASTSVS